MEQGGAIGARRYGFFLFPPDRSIEGPFIRSGEVTLGDDDRVLVGAMKKT